MLPVEEYLVVYDDQNLIPAEDWHMESTIELFDGLPRGYESTKLICECGVSKVMPNGRHSDYCPLYNRNW
jgi:hypothetical protein